MEGFVGLDVGGTINLIHYFEWVSDSIFSDLESAVFQFAESVLKNWASPKALEFEKKYDNKLAQLYLQPYISLKNILFSICDAANEMANANGNSIDFYSFINSEMPNRPDHVFPYYLDQSPNGIVGMDISMFPHIIESFELRINNAVVNLESQLPSSKDLSLYDTTGSLVSAYESTITKNINYINELSKEIIDSINDAISTEINVMDMAAKMAEQHLNQ